MPRWDTVRYTMVIRVKQSPAWETRPVLGWVGLVGEEKTPVVEDRTAWKDQKKKCMWQCGNLCFSPSVSLSLSFSQHRRFDPFRENKGMGIFVKRESHTLNPYGYKNTKPQVSGSKNTASAKLKAVSQEERLQKRKERFKNLLENPSLSQWYI